MIRDARPEDLAAIQEIYNEAIVNTTAVYDYKPYTMAARLAWYEEKRKAGLPVLVFEENNLVNGFATFGPFRAKPAYKYTIEHSVYVHNQHQGKGIGTRLMQELIKLANAKGYATMIAGIDAGNLGSRAMHEKMGFILAGTICKAGYKFGRWLDLSLYQYELAGPANPVEE